MNKDVLVDLLVAVKDESLSKDSLDKLHSALTHLHSDLQMELADIEKEEALFYAQTKELMPESTDISIKRKWKVTKSGLRDIELNRHIKVVSKELKSLQSRLYNIY